MHALVAADELETFLLVFGPPHSEIRLGDQADCTLPVRVVFFRLFHDDLASEVVVGGYDGQDDALGLLHVVLGQLPRNLNVRTGLPGCWSVEEARQVNEGDRLHVGVGNLHAQNISREAPRVTLVDTHRRSRLADDVRESISIKTSSLERPMSV